MLRNIYSLIPAYGITMKEVILVMFWKPSYFCLQVVIYLWLHRSAMYFMHIMEQAQSFHVVERLVICYISFLAIIPTFCYLRRCLNLSWSCQADRTSGPVQDKLWGTGEDLMCTFLFMTQDRCIGNIDFRR